MRCLALLSVLLLLVGWVSCACEKDPGSRYRSVSNCPINRMFQPMCGSDGCSYINKDALACAQKENPQLRMVHDGVCEEDLETDDRTMSENNLL